MKNRGHTTAMAAKAVSPLFFLSGMTGLSYEVIWFKQFSHVWGSSTLAMASVVGAFLLGLGLGARLWGSIADRTPRPVLWYGACEIGIGILAFLIPWETDLLWSISIEYYARLREWPVACALFRCATTFVVIGPACMLMGGTLPLLVRHRAMRQRIDQATGWLYGINTLGAAAGCYFMGFHLLPELGVFWSTIATAGANLAVGLAAILVATRRSPIGNSEEGISDVGEFQDSCIGITREESPVVTQEYPVIAIFLASAIAGGAALGLQTVWNRQLALVLGSSTYAFSAMLVVVLGGIGLGSLLFRSLVLRFPDGVSLLFYLLSATIISAVAGMWLLPFAADCVGVSVPLRANYVTNAAVCIMASALIEFLPAVAMGMLFPCLIHVSRGRIASAGTFVGNLYAYNTAGTLVGAIAAPVWFVPRWGTHAAAGIALLAYVGTAVLLPMPSRIRGRAVVATALATIAFGLYWKRPDDPLRTNMGMFLYGYRIHANERPQVLFFKEGTTSNVLVTKTGDEISFRVNGKVDGSSRGDMSMQLGLAYLPRFLNPGAANVLVIGFGTGSTSGSSLLFPGTRVTCCEIEPAIVAAAPNFANVNHSPLESCQFNVVFDDARAYVQGTNEKYDLILSEPSNPWIAGVSNLFTAEFYRIASQKLAPNGIFAQWIQTYSFAPEDYTMIVRTMRHVFPYQRLIRINSGDTILIGSLDSLDRDASTVRASQLLVDQTPVIQTDLKAHFETADVAALLLTRIVLDEKALKAFVEADPSRRLNLDRDLQLEFRAARHLYEYRDDKAVDRSILAAARSDWFIQHFKRLRAEARHSASLHELATLFLTADHKQTAAALVELGLSQDPTSPTLLANHLMIADRIDSAAVERLLASSDDLAAVEANRVGVACWKKGQYSDAIIVFERLSQRFPNAPNVWTNLAINYALSGNQGDAERAHRRALELDPTNEFSRRESGAHAKRQ